MRTLNVRIGEEAHGLLRSLCEEMGEAAPSVLRAALEALRRERFLAAVEADFARLHRDPEAARSYYGELSRVERAAVADGLEPEDWSDA